MKLVSIPKEVYEEYKLDVIFNCYKWDPQFLDSYTIARHVLVITKEEHKELMKLTEALDKETRQAENFLLEHLALIKPLKLPRVLKKEIKKMKNYQAEKHIRLMRYDFHPIVDGWAISEVNSDVPGGFAEASLMPQVAITLYKDKKYQYKNFSDTLIEAIIEKVKPQGNIMLVHCTCYSDDRQIMQFLGDRLITKGFHPIYGAADHLRFEQEQAFSILDGNEGKIDAIIRFTPIEWVQEIKPKKWQGYFNTITPSCNHPIAIFAQTKRFPLLWNTLEENGIQMSTWKKLLPETIEVKDVKNRKGFIYKPVYGRVGEKISIKEACRENEYEEIMKDVKRHPSSYIAQKKFVSRALQDENGKTFHVCIGSYSVEGKAAGYYARISETLRIDSHAKDIPVIIEEE